MPLINLIHEQRQATRNNERKERMALAGLIATAVVCAGAWGSIWFAGENTKNEAAELQAQVDKLKPIKQAIQANKPQEELAPQIAGEHLYYIRQTIKKKEEINEIVCVKLPETVRPAKTTMVTGKIVSSQNNAPLKACLTFSTIWLGVKFDLTK